MIKLDKKLKFIDLTNELAHANIASIQTTLGAVAVTEQAIINEAHRRGLILIDKRDMVITVMTLMIHVLKRIDKWIFNMDLNFIGESSD